MKDLEKSYKLVKSKIPKTAKLLCVSKNQSLASIEELYNLGQRDFGENKVQELALKAQSLTHLTEIRWHFIGHLQSNKINQLLEINNLFFIHSLDRMSLLEKILTKKPVNTVSLFVQINTSGEKEKGGFETWEQASKAVAMIKKSDSFNLAGLMTMGKIRTDDFVKDAHMSFKTLQEMRDIHLPDTELSMGMSNDFEIALEYGANWVRVGSKIFT